MAGGAFAAGSRLRAEQEDFVPTTSVTIQTNALLRFTPECPPVALGKADISTSENKELMASVVGMLKTYYVEPINAEQETKLARGAVKGMVSALSDPDSHFLDPSERKLLDDASHGHFSGMGAILALKNEKVKGLSMINVVVVAPMPGSPAEAAGLKAGDYITHLNGRPIITYNPFESPEMKDLAEKINNGEIKEAEARKASIAIIAKFKNGLSISEALDRLTGYKSGEINLTVERPGQSKPIRFAKVRLTNISVAPVVTKTVGNGIMYIHISQFNDRAVSDFSAALKRASNEHTKAIILDLRNNPGGQMNCANLIASKITGGGLFASLQERGHSRNITAEKTTGIHIPVAVLVNGGTASVAELVAGDLRENSSAILVGSKTFGDGVAQTPLTLKDGSVAVLTTGRMMTSKGFDFNGKGLTPDKVILQDNKKSDAQLSEAEKLLQTKPGRI